jgi:hypothetical protein
MAQGLCPPSGKSSRRDEVARKKVQTSLEAVPVSRKPVEEYEQTKPHQLILFELLHPEERDFSQTVELYDFMPKYNWGKAQRLNDQYLPSLNRQFEYRGRHYKVRIEPARIADNDGNERDHYPGQREELVEDALRKLVCEGHGIFLDNQAGVVFTLYQLHQELKRRGHNYNLNQVKQALLICAKTKITLSTDDGKTMIVSSLFETLGLSTRQEWEAQPKTARAYIRFNTLITQSIQSLNFRRLNYTRSMEYRTVIARQLHKRLSHHYTQASIKDPYNILLTTIIRDLGLTRYKHLSHNLRDVQEGLQELEEKGAILSYVTTYVRPAGLKKGYSDVKFLITPHPRFVSEIMESNRRTSRTQQNPITQ